MPKVTFDSLPPSDRPEHMTPEWSARWNVICDRLLSLAEKRGGHGVRHGDDLMLHAPWHGACIRVVLTQPGVARVDADDLHVSSDWALTDEQFHDLENIVEAIIDGTAEVTVQSSFKVANSGGGFSEPITWTLPGWSA